MEFIRFAARGRLDVRPAIYPPEYVFRGGSWLANGCSSPQASGSSSSSGGGSLLPSGGSGGGGGEVLLRTRRVLGLLERQLRSPGWSQCVVALAVSAAAGSGDCDCGGEGDGGDGGGGGDCGGGGGDDGSGFRFARPLRLPGWSQGCGGCGGGDCGGGGGLGLFFGRLKSYIRRQGIRRGM